MRVPVRQLELFLTHRCNLRCSYCYAAPARSAAADLAPQVADRAVDLLFAAGAASPRLRLDLWGGEPFLRPDLIARVGRRARHLAARTGQELTLVAPTNGTLLTAAALDLVDELDLQLSLSLDGVTAPAPERCLPDGGPSWPLVEQGLARLATRHPTGPLPPVRLTVTPARADRVAAEVWELWRLGFGQVSPVPATGAHWDERTTGLLDASLAELAAGLVARIAAGQRVPALPPLLRRLAPGWAARRGATLATPALAGCGAGASRLAVSTRGAVYPCHRFLATPTPPAELCLGDVRTGLADSPRWAELARAGPPDADPRCASCPARWSCRPCPARSWQTTGTLTGFCEEVCWAQQRFHGLATALHDRLRGHPAYAAWLDALLLPDPEYRLLPLRAQLATDPEPLLDRALRLLAAGGRPP